MSETAHVVARGRPGRARRLLAVALSCTLLCLTGCQSHRAHPAAASSPPAAADRSLVADLTLPVLAYVPSAAVRQEVTAAEGVTAARCLVKYGLHWTPALPASAPHPASELDREYGISDPQAAKLYGYHLPPHHNYDYRLAVPQSDPVANVLEGVDSANHVVTTYAGVAVPRDGCLGQARNEVGGQALEDLTADTVLLSASQLANRDPQVTALFGQWSACMASAGFHYADPLAAIGSTQWTDTATVSATEVRTALADLSCKARLQMLPKWVAVESHYEQTLIARDRAVLESTIKAWNQAGVRARALLAAK